ncbi:DUF433 domain-containing protein [Kovacikia minuta CCNUW1]|uniref:DUF433 domain-containing protein n=1 Tax=Kovacikia minuta TaxID=2931930 RepID=UPI001CC9BF97|nr:DUF433 domain-containing protein [Kovacikia minuta]UBF24234.1 DUF433 domain-containing protein [Kovacikia minuta CCNUW1]
MNLPSQLQKEAEKWAQQQGISLDEFILWAVAEKVGALSQQFDDPNFPEIQQRRGASGLSASVIRGTGVRVQTIVVTARQWGFTPSQIADQYGLTEAQIHSALAFYETHRLQIDAAIATEQTIEAAHV